MDNAGVVEKDRRQSADQVSARRSGSLDEARSGSAAVARRLLRRLAACGVAVGLTSVLTVAGVSPALAATTAAIGAPTTAAPGEIIPVSATFTVEAPASGTDLPSVLTVSPGPVSGGGVVYTAIGTGTPPLESCGSIDANFACEWPGAAEGQSVTMTTTMTVSDDASGTFEVVLGQIDASNIFTVLARQVVTIVPLPEPVTPTLPETGLPAATVPAVVIGASLLAMGGLVLLRERRNSPPRKAIRGHR